jgi:hypothetical protein
VVSVVATGHSGRRFKPSQGDGLLKDIKIHSTPSFGWEVSRRRHVIRFYVMLKIR